MKIISYTHMREHLTEVLDALRNGEQITVTQRSKADLVLSSEPVLTPVSRESGVPGCKLTSGPVKTRASTPVKNVTPQDKSTRDGQFMVAGKEGRRGKDPVSGKGLSFSDAKERTKVRHAGVIKMLSDK